MQRMILPLSFGYSYSLTPTNVKPSLRQIAFEGALSTDGYA